jgi:hypothetical protein
MNYRAGSRPNDSNTKSIDADTSATDDATDSCHDRESEDRVSDAAEVWPLSQASSAASPSCEGIAARGATR